MDEQNNLAFSVWHGLNNQTLLFNILRKNMVQILAPEKIIKVQGKCPADLNEALFKSYVRKNNKMLIVGLRIESEKFNIISGKISTLIDALKQLNVLDKESAVILLDANLYKKIFNISLGEQEYFAKGTFPGSATGFVTASFNGISLFPLRPFIENTIYLIDNNSLYINLVKPTEIVNGLLETEMELVCADHLKQYKIILD